MLGGQRLVAFDRFAFSTLALPPWKTYETAIGF